MVAQLQELTELVGTHREAWKERNEGGPGQRLAGVPGAGNLREATDIISKAADAIAEMSRRNKELEAAATRSVLHYKSEAEATSKRNAELLAQIDAMQLDFDSQTDALRRQIDDLQSRLANTLASLDEKTQDAEFANEWLTYLAGEIKQRLADAPKTFAEMATEVRPSHEGKPV